MGHLRLGGCEMRAILAAGIAAILGACAYSYTDDNGNQRVIGLVDMSIGSTGNPRTFAGTVVDLSTIGFAVHSDADGGSLTLGYSRAITGSLRNHSLVLGDPRGIATTGRQGAQ